MWDVEWKKPSERFRPKCLKHISLMQGVDLRVCDCTLILSRSY